MMIFRYKSVRRPDKTEIKSPSIPITLIGNSLKVDVVALLDSGADISTMPKDIAELLNINLNKEKGFVFGVGGKVEAIQTEIEIIIERGHEHYNLKIPFKIILGDYDFPILLGRQGFFDNFSILFNQKEMRVSLKRV